MRKLSEFIETQLSIANAEYEEKKEEAKKSGNPQRITIGGIETKNNLKKDSLKNWRERAKKRAKKEEGEKICKLIFYSD